MSVIAGNVSRRLKEQGIALRDEWVAGCLESARTRGIVSENPAIDWVMEQFLVSDMRRVGSGCLPNEAAPVLDGTHPGGTIRGKFVLQIDELIDAGASVDEGRLGFQDSHQRRMMKLNLTDGVRRVVAIERSPLPSLTHETLPGAKIALRDVPIRRGLILLGGDNAMVLGGCVRELADAAAAVKAAAERLKRPALEELDLGKRQQTLPRTTVPLVVPLPLSSKQAQVAPPQQPQQAAPQPFQGSLPSPSSPPLPQQSTSPTLAQPTRQLSSIPAAVSAVPAAAAAAAVLVAPATAAAPLLSLSQALERASSGELKRAVVRAAAVGTLASTFGWVDGMFTLSIMIDDGSTTTIADLSSPLVERMLGLSAAAFAANVEHGNEDENARCMKEMEVALAALEGMMSLELGCMTAPVITSVDQPSPRDCWQLHSRVSKLMIDSGRK